jgi:hypothetical protein
LHLIVYPLFAGPAKGPFDMLKGRRELKLLSQHQLDQGRLRVAYEVG